MDLYYFHLSPPCRAVKLLGQTLGTEFHVKVTSTIKEDQKTPEFLAINPQHTIPTLVVGNNVILKERQVTMS